MRLNDIETFLCSGWFNRIDLDISRLIEPGQVVTIILSDAPFTVPEDLPGGAVTLGSKQKEFGSLGFIRMRVLEREVDQ